MPNALFTATASGLRSDFRRDHHVTLKRLRSEKVCLLYDKFWQPVLTSVIAAILLVAAMWPVVSAEILLGWLGAVALVSALRLGIAYRYHQLPVMQQQCKRWLWRFSAGAIAAGCVWGAGSWLLFTPQHSSQVAALAIVMAGIAAGGVITLSAVWWVALGFVLPIMLPLLVQFFLLGTPLALLIGTMLVLFLGLIVVASQRFSRIIHDNIALRVSMAAREAMLLESENRYRSIFNHSPLGVLHFDCDGRVTDCNDKLLTILGVERGQMMGYCMLSSSADEGVTKGVHDALSQGTGYYEGTYVLPNAEQGTPLRAFFNAVHSAGDEKVGGVAIIEDFTERKRYEAIIYRQAYYDALTDMPNRRLFIERLESLWHSPTPCRGMLMFLDLDRFKLINDTLGHAAGDDLLVQVARRLDDCLGGEDIAARLSGDEFVLLVRFDNALDNTVIEAHSMAYAERVQLALSAPYRLESRWVDVTPSIGYTCINSAKCDHEEALKQADIAMYRAKSAGRDRMCRYQPEMRDDFQRDAERDTTP
ncbi:sensor domain-containing diguanylate cyclase [Halomonas vilamensis]|uniref:Sensor domain-containing diguanylate cyclase n=1 Tax=Vreelandella vilamensis TaxID=531309 RepID=A0ABU1H6U0_9GAMM|nr:sensor domain-containing diguanylate cyclase [Halomonas vilamensis]MDR5900020.1 sensor domain-containing diguanylate cyclase [Halomonas vilamensis]